MGKKTSPYALEKEYWETLPKEARQWMDKYAKAVEFGNFQVLQELCDKAPSDQFEEIKSEVMYERDFYKRDQYTIPSQYNSTYTEWDFSWSAPQRVANKRAKIERYYETEPANPEFYKEPGKKVRFK